MTTGLSKRILAIWRNRWVRVVGFSLALCVGYIQSAGLSAHVVFDARLGRLPFKDKLQDAYFAFYKPVFRLCGYGTGPNLVSKTVVVCLGKQRRVVAARLLDLARVDIHNQELDAAERMACFVQSFDIKYDLFDDRPNLVLSDLDKLRRNVPLSKFECKLMAWDPPDSAGDSPQNDVSISDCEHNCPLHEGQVASDSSARHSD